MKEGLKKSHWEETRARVSAVLLLLASCALTAHSAQAGIILGDSVDVAMHAPTLGEVCFLCGGVTQVSVADDASDAIEPYLPGGGWFQVDINSNSIAISFERDLAWQSGGFVGLVISGIDWLEGRSRALPGVQLDTALLSLDQVADRLSHTDSSVTFNWQGLVIPAGTRFEISLAAAAPPVTNVNEPAYLFLLLALLMLLLGRNLRVVRGSYFRTE